MASPYFIGVDIGTAGTKASIFDVHGNQLATTYEESKLYYPRVGWVEQKPEDFYTSTINTVRELIKRSGVNPKDVASIAFSGQMAGILAIDENWNAVTPYDSWLDIRCKDYIDYLNKNYADLLINVTGVPPTVDHLPKMLWWKNERPEIFNKICKFIVPAVYVAGKLVGLSGNEAFYDYTYVTFTGLIDAEKMKWSEELSETFGISLDKMPKIVKPWEIVGELKADEAEKMGLVEGIPIVAGAGDGVACTLGAGLTEPGRCLDIAGTASAFYVSTDKMVPDTKFKTLIYLKSVVPELWNVGAYVNGGGLCLRWFRDEIAKYEKKVSTERGEDPYKLLDALASEVPPGSDGLFFVPHLGGRAYPYNPKIRGVWFGFSWKHTLSYFFRAILESICYEYHYYLSIIKELLTNLELKEVRCIGGGSRSSIWNQIKADVLNVPYVLLNKEEYAVLALAALGGYAVGFLNDYVKSINEWVKPVRRIMPNEKMHEKYRNYAKFYEQLLNDLDKTFSLHERLGSETH
ncbi:MAG: FGGY family carbohydrate kinase [Candidatus Bathyarchaeia archaeon]